MTTVDSCCLCRKPPFAGCRTDRLTHGLPPRSWKPSPAHAGVPPIGSRVTSYLRIACRGRHGPALAADGDRLFGAVICANGQKNKSTPRSAARKTVCSCKSKPSTHSPYTLRCRRSLARTVGLAAGHIHWRGRSPRWPVHAPWPPSRHTKAPSPAPEWIAIVGRFTTAAPLFVRISAGGTIRSC
jgi:hypothetical protein